MIDDYEKRPRLSPPRASPTYSPARPTSRQRRPVYEPAANGARKAFRWRQFNCKLCLWRRSRLPASSWRSARNAPFAHPGPRSQV